MLISSLALPPLVLAGAVPLPPSSPSPSPSPSQEDH